MPSRRVNVYEGGVYNSDTTNTANSIVERDSTRKIPASILEAVAQLIVGGVMDIDGLAVTASQAVDASVTFYEADATSALIELTLPPVATVPGRIFVLNKTDASGNAAKFKGSGGTELINGTNLYSTSTQWAALRVRANTAGTAWYSW